MSGLGGVYMDRVASRMRAVEARMRWQVVEQARLSAAAAAVEFIDLEGFELLRLTIQAQSDATSSIYMTMNGITAAGGYDTQRLSSSGTNSSSSQQTNQNHFILTNAVYQQDPQVALASLYISNWSTVSPPETFRARGWWTNSASRNMYGAFHRELTAAEREYIDTLRLEANNGNFRAGSIFTLEGVRRL